MCVQARDFGRCLFGAGPEVYRLGSLPNKVEETSKELGVHYGEKGWIMLTVSDTATEALRDALDETEADVAFRLVSAPEGYRMQLDSPSEQDRIIENEDRVVLMLDPEIDDKLTGAVLDVQQGDQPRLTLRPAIELPPEHPNGTEKGDQPR